MKLTQKEMEIVEILEKDSRIAIEDIAKMVQLKYGRNRSRP